MKKRLIAIITITLAAVLMLGMMNLSVFAEDVNYGPSDYHYDLKANADSRTLTYFVENGKTTSLDVADSTMATAKFNNNKYGTCIKITFKKEGTVSFTHNYVKDDQETCANWTCNIIDTKYTCPVKTLKLGSINLTKKLGHSQNITGKPFKGKVTSKAKKGWKLTEISKYNGTSFEKTGKNPEITKLKKGKTVTLKKGQNLRLVFKKGDKTAKIVYKAR